MQKLLLTLAALTLLSACNSGPASENSAAPATGILGGTNVTENTKEANSTVFILLTEMKDGKPVPSAICTGTLIAENLVLTAAHCLTEKKTVDDKPVVVAKPLNELYVMWGTAPLQKLDPASIRRVTQTKMHEKFMAGPTDPRDHNDIGLLKFEGARPANTRIAMLPDAADVPRLVKFTAIGYGRVNGVKSQPGDSGQLRTVDLTGMFIFPHNREFVIDQTGGRGACMGDSGGPAMIFRPTGQPVVIGLVSRAISIGATKEQVAAPDFDVCKWYSIYTSVLGFNDWITTGAAELLK